MATTSIGLAPKQTHKLLHYILGMMTAITLTNYSSTLFLHKVLDGIPGILTSLVTMDTSGVMRGERREGEERRRGKEKGGERRGRREGEEDGRGGEGRNEGMVKRNRGREKVESWGK